MDSINDLKNELINKSDNKGLYVGCKVYIDEPKYIYEITGFYFGSDPFNDSLAYMASIRTKGTLTSWNTNSKRLKVYKEKKEENKMENINKPKNELSAEMQKILKSLQKKYKDSNFEQEKDIGLDIVLNDGETRILTIYDNIGGMKFHTTNKSVEGIKKFSELYPLIDETLNNYADYCIKRDSENFKKTSNKKTSKKKEIIVEDNQEFKAEDKIEEVIEVVPSEPVQEVEVIDDVNTLVDIGKKYRDYTIRIKRNLNNVVNNFFSIGYSLYQIKENKFYQAAGYIDVFDYAEHEFGIKTTTVKNFINVVVKYSKNINGLPSDCIDEKYQDFSYSQLVELLPVKDGIEKYDPTMTIKDIRENRYLNKLKEKFELLNEKLIIECITPIENKLKELGYKKEVRNYGEHSNGFDDNYDYDFSKGYNLSFKIEFDYLKNEGDIIKTNENIHLVYYINFKSVRFDLSFNELNKVFNYLDEFLIKAEKFQLELKEQKKLDKKKAAEQQVISTSKEATKTTETIKQKEIIVENKKEIKVDNFKTLIPSFAYNPENDNYKYADHLVKLIINNYPGQLDIESMKIYISSDLNSDAYKIVITDDLYLIIERNGRFDYKYNLFHDGHLVYEFNITDMLSDLFNKIDFHGSLFNKSINESSDDEDSMYDYETENDDSDEDYEQYK